LIVDDSQTWSETKADVDSSTKVLAAFIAWMFLTRSDAGSGSDPDDGDEGAEPQSDAGMLECDRDAYEINEERKIVFSLHGCVFCFKFSCVLKPPADGQAQKKKAEAGNDHRCDIDGDGERVQLLLQNIGGKEGQQRQAEEKSKVGIQDEVIGFLGAVDEVMMVDPVDPGEGEGDEIEAKRGENIAQARDAVLVWNFQLEHHDGDDDGDDSVGEGFEPGWGGDMAGHRRCLGRSIQRRLWK
jgi:hypothetical protein